MFLLLLQYPNVPSELRRTKALVPRSSIAICYACKYLTQVTFFYLWVHFLTIVRHDNMLYLYLFLQSGANNYPFTVTAMPGAAIVDSHEAPAKVLD